MDKVFLHFSFSILHFGRRRLAADRGPWRHDAPWSTARKQSLVAGKTRKAGRHQLEPVALLLGHPRYRTQCARPAASTLPPFHHVRSRIESSSVTSGVPAPGIVKHLFMNSSEQSNESLLLALGAPGSRHMIVPSRRCAVHTRGRSNSWGLRNMTLQTARARSWRKSRFDRRIGRISRFRPNVYARPEARAHWWQSESRPLFIALICDG
jgi:hypothetical protein